MRTVTVDENFIQSLLANQRVLDRFPFLKRASRAARPVKGGCCGRKARTAPRTAPLKSTLFSMSTGQLNQIKAVLGVDKLVFYFPSREGVRKLER